MIDEHSCPFGRQLWIVCKILQCTLSHREAASIHSKAESRYYDIIYTRHFGANYRFPEHFLPGDNQLFLGPGPTDYRWWCWSRGIKYEPPHFSASAFLRPKSLSLGYPTFLWAFLTFCSHFCLPSPLKKAKFLHPSLKSNPLARSLTVTKKLLEYEQQQKRQLGYKERERRELEFLTNI